MKYLKNNEVDSAKSMLGFSLADLGKDEEIFRFEIKKASDILTIYGIPDTSVFFAEKDSLGLMQRTYINVPISVKESPDNKLLKVTIRVSFLDRIGDYKLASYEIITDYRKSIIRPFN
ncbi:hypothetical protein KTO58_21175 [Chitinophaga pendula]|uniref:hypothetical protein n=1 Tax=Chitinophaga TaxID=79328 RepID=UPI0012FDC92C|nr:MULTISPECIES: hypothetical protein [Chitinophaga]UCJ06162.1 hypothetical protein KTO58_21175 [Chitinophaga pendula]